MQNTSLNITNVKTRYLRYLKLERNYSTNTIDNKDVFTLTFEDVEHFVFMLHEHQIGAVSQARIISGVKNFYKFLLIENLIEDNPTELLESPIIGEHLPEVLSVEEVNALENSIDLSKWEGQRNKAIIEVLFSCGLRVSELINLKLSNLHLDEMFIRVLGKGSKERLVPISPQAIKELRLWFLDRNMMRIKQGEEDFVFLNRRGAHLTRTMILILLKRQAVAAGIQKNISPHTLRHSFATELLKGGADLTAIQAMLGHESVGTTEIYTHIDVNQLRSSVLQFHPRNKKKHKP